MLTVAIAELLFFISIAGTASNILVTFAFESNTEMSVDCSFWLFVLNMTTISAGLVTGGKLDKTTVRAFPPIDSLQIKEEYAVSI